MNRDLNFAIDRKEKNIKAIGFKMESFQQQRYDIVRAKPFKTSETAVEFLTV